MMNKDQNKGVTLVELIISIAFVSIIILISTNLFLVGNKANSTSIKEYDIQSSVRMTTEEVNKVARYSKAVFAVPKTYIANNAMDPDWKYFMVSPNKKKIVSMEYNSANKKFEERVLVKEQNNIEYEIFFEKVKNSTLDNILKYVIKAYLVDSEGHRSEKEKFIFESAVESINSVQVLDKGTGIPADGMITQSTSIALAYKNDGQSSGKGNEYAYITLVVDVSGSMKLLPTDNDAKVTVPDNEKKGSRIQKVREALTGIVEQFAHEENVFVSLVPFSTTANYPLTTADKTENRNNLHPIFDVHYNQVFTNNTNNNPNLTQEISNKLTANGGTNTGDGLRRAYQLHLNFRNRMSSIVKETEKVHHYTILLVDGQSTFETGSNLLWEDKGEYVSNGTNKYIWKVDYILKDPINYYQQDKNITTSSQSLDTTPKNPNKYTTKGNKKYYGEPRDNVTTELAILGSGNTFVGTGYINKIGNAIKAFNSNKGIKSYVIGYSKGMSARVNEIGSAIGTDSSKIFSYDDDDFDLQEVFDAIANDILADYWVLTGPQIRN